jgi:transcriptional antiterminator RfaH
MNHIFDAWYLLYTRPRMEKKVEKALTEIGVEGFLPIRKSLRIWSGRRKYVDSPLFPSYVFIRLKDMKQYYDSLGLEGVVNFVKIGKQVARVSEQIVDNLKILVRNECDFEITSERFQPGKKVIICDGPLTGVVCEVVKVASKQKILVRVNLINRSLMVNLSFDSLVSAPI